jgi:catechol 2,3-dioxygenase-like lactoylglutathione lyase family enzyme
MEPRISMITLGVRDVQVSYNFYSKILGFPSPKGIEGDIVFFNINHMLLAICPKEKLAEDACLPDDGSGFSGNTLVHIVKSQQEVDEIIQNLRKAGVRITKEPQYTFWGGYDAYFQDPDGYSWEITWIPSSWFEEHAISEL